MLLERLLIESGATIDNEAFRALVEERAKAKNTKEIARKAVERKSFGLENRSENVAAPVDRRRRKTMMIPTGKTYQANKNPKN